MHNLGGVQNSAPHSTQAGHCWDEYDTMCYSDGGNHAMVQVCPGSKEYLLDCNTDDYFSTYPEPGSYLATHWNSADSRFLVGGGDGAGGGTTGTPTTLGATIGVNNPAVPGLATEVSVTPSLPTGRTVASVGWKSARTDCVFADPASLQSTVTCNATATGATTVTATVTDSTGATKSVSSPLSFATGTARPLTIALTVDGQAGSASVCTGAGFPLTATVRDAASGQPVKGLSAAFTKRVGTATTTAAAGTAVTTAAGAGSASATAATATTYAAKVVVGKVYAAAASADVVATPGKCTVTLSAQAGSHAVYTGDSVTVTGSLTRAVGGQSVPVVGAAVPLRLSYASGTTTKVLTLATAKSLADGSFSVSVKPTTSGTLSAMLVGSTAYQEATASLGAITVATPSTGLTGEPSTTDVGYGGSVVVTGRLTRTAGGTVTGVGSSTVSVKLAAPGKTALVIGSGKTTADGTYTVTVPVKSSGALSVAYAGTASQPAATTPLGDVTVGTWSTSTTLSSAASGTYRVLSGTVTRSYKTTTEPARTVKVRIYFTPTSTGVPALTATLTTTATGTFTTKLVPKATGSFSAVASTNVGHSDSTSSAVAVTVG